MRNLLLGLFIILLQGCVFIAPGIGVEKCVKFCKEHNHGGILAIYAQPGDDLCTCLDKTQINFSDLKD